MVDAVKNLNGTIWIFASLLTGMVVVQALLFLRLALRFNKENNLLTKSELTRAARTGAVSVVGPAISVIVVALTLIAMVGSAVTFMRCGVIGAPGWELLMANTSSESVGVAFGSAGFTEAVFVLCIFGMTFASAPYFLNTMITLKPLDKAVTKSVDNANKKESFTPTLGNAAMYGIMGYSVIDYMKTLPGAIAFVVAAGVAYAVMEIAKKTGKKWLNDWNLAFAMVIGMTVAQVVKTIAG